MGFGTVGGVPDPWMGWEHGREHGGHLLSPPWAPSWVWGGASEAGQCCVLVDDWGGGQEELSLLCLECAPPSLLPSLVFVGCCVTSMGH